ncbi:MAG: DUF5615 family PIN-like protein [Coleofasciculus sp.]
MKKIRWHLDEQVDRAIAQALKQRGVDVTTTPEVGLLGATDEEQLAFAISQQRVIFTHDEDFLILHQQGVEHYGITYCHQNSRSIGDIVRGLILISEVLEPLDMHNHVEFI